MNWIGVTCKSVFQCGPIVTGQGRIFAEKRLDGLEPVEPGFARCCAVSSDVSDTRVERTLRSAELHRDFRALLIRMRSIEGDCLESTVENAHAAMNAKARRKTIEVKVDELDNVLARA